MTLAIFDLDNTLLAGDSDHAWGEYLIEQGHVDGAWYKAENDRFYSDYCRGELDVIAYSEFVFSVLAREEPETLAAWHAGFMAQKVSGMILPKGRDLLAKHRDAGHRLLIITATNRFITEPIARELDVDTLIATEPEMEGGRYTGKVKGIPCYQHGKIERLQEWLTLNNESPEGCWFYSDSRNDIPLLEFATHPVAVDPDEALRAHAASNAWPVLSLR
ncbi:MAG: HAD family hydrolase [Moraxellaceae bacterium]|nr:HAD family hydrolase [Moraxellaceae bacterium]MBP7230283.1 HAD family hydrolase [Moraxellaceae bacterium]MBP8851861.1 HAD family hydrolase [Moraxellaceae bacterium]MBP9044809.1 HAD family hydrolase [Moraxellaceae bacterium]MBP9730442.1 HAD family hydrolase [Moraxellaceae bacterium]